MRTSTILITVAAIAAGLITLVTKMDSVSGVLFFLPFSFGPLLVTLVIAFFCRRASSLWLLLGSSLTYFGWYYYIYLEAFHWHVDPQSPIALLFVGFYSLPVMLPVWIVALCKRKPKSSPNRYHASRHRR